MTVWLIGSDEVGYGAIAGPLIVCAVAIPTGWEAPEGLKDSKQLSKDAISRLGVWLTNTTCSGILFRLEARGPDEIDGRGVGAMLNDAHSKAVANVFRRIKAKEGDSVLAITLDGDRIPPELRSMRPKVQAIPKADANQPEVSAASVIAKMTQIATMEVIGNHYTDFAFGEHHGYPTPAHKKELVKFGPCGAHRNSYKPVKEARKLHGG